MTLMENSFATPIVSRIIVVLTFHVEVHILENDEEPSGMGEAGLPSFAPALTEAIYDLTGRRIRKLPFNLNDF
jgi:CO/xanthine dehydrogenase Mo-binding subunit